MVTIRDRSFLGRGVSIAASELRHRETKAKYAAESADRQLKRRRREEAQLGRVAVRLAKTDSVLRRMLLDGVAALAPTNQDALALLQPGGIIDGLRAIPDPVEPVAEPPTFPTKAAKVSKKSPSDEPWARDLTYDDSPQARLQRLDELRIHDELTGKQGATRERNARWDGIAERDGWSPPQMSYTVRPESGLDAGQELHFAMAVEALNYVFNRSDKRLFPNDPAYPAFRDGERVTPDDLSQDARLISWAEERDQACARLNKRKRSRKGH